MKNLSFTSTVSHYPALNGMVAVRGNPKPALIALDVRGETVEVLDRATLIQIRDALSRVLEQEESK